LEWDDGFGYTLPRIIFEEINMDWLLRPETWIAFLTLVVLELVLGVDNVIFISILSGKLPESERGRARTTGILAAVITRVLLLLSLSWIINLKHPLFVIRGFEVTGKDFILLVGGLFLLWKSTHEIHQKLEGVEGHASTKIRSQFWGVIVQIMLLDIVFSLDSIITAVGMIDPEKIVLMIAAVVVSAIVMVFTSGPLSRFVERHPTIKMLALSFLLLIGFTLVAEGLHQHISKGYIYFAMGFSVLVEMLNLRMAKRGVAVRPVNLRDAYKPSELTPIPANGFVPIPAKVNGKKPPVKKNSSKKKKSK
jgi:predicted tellurium resistance membrane protein TerC